MGNKSIREYKEMKNLFGDVMFNRQAWKSVGQLILQNPATEPIAMQYDKDGNPSISSQIERYSYEQLKKDIDSIDSEEHRQPTNLEMILMCQMIRARYDTNAAIFIRDTLGAKPVDETKIDAQINNPYESLSDEELETIAKMREQQAALEAANDAK